MAHNHALTVASRALETIALSKGIPPERIAYVPNGPGINKRLAASSDQSPVSNLQSPILLVYSRLFEFDTGRLTAILQGVKTAVPDLTILLVGAGLYDADAAQFRRQLAEAGLADAVKDVGWVELEALPALLRAADVGVYLMDDTLLNRTKCPVKLADMAAAGAPVVAEAVGQVNEYVVHGRTGYLRPTGDIEGLTADLIHLLQNPAERERFSEAAKRHIAAHFNWADLAERVEQAYTQRDIG